MSYTNPATSGTLLTTWGYDTTVPNRAVSITESNDTYLANLAYGYDGALRTREEFSVPSSWGSAVKVNKAFDANQRVSDRFLSPDSTTAGASDVSYGFDTDGRVHTISNGSSIYTLNYQPQNGLLANTVLVANTRTVTETYSYDAYGALSETKTTLNGGQILDFAYVRDVLARVTQKTEQQSGAWHSWSYHYTTPYQFFLSDFFLGGVQQTFGYDVNGNFNVYFGASGFVHDAQDRMLNHPWGSYGYDANGAVSTQNGGGTPTFWYDALSNLRKVNSISYAVDAKNRRIAKFTANAYTDGWVYDGERIIAQIDSAGNVVAQFVYATKTNVPDLMFAKNGSSWDAWRILSDQVGSVRALVSMPTGVTTYFDYRDPWGGTPQNVQYTSNGTHQLPFAFAGGLYDPDTGLYRFGARDYNPWLGRWWSKDPIRFNGGDNLYMYCNNDPVNCTDPSGKLPVNDGSDCGSANCSDNNGDPSVAGLLCLLSGGIIGCPWPPTPLPPPPPPTEPVCSQEPTENPIHRECIDASHDFNDWLDFCGTLFWRDYPVWTRISCREQAYKSVTERQNWCGWYFTE